MQQFKPGFPKIFTLILSCLFLSITSTQAQQPVKGLPPDLPLAQLIIICYEPKNFANAGIKNGTETAQALENQKKASAEANKNLALAAKYAYPFSYQLISRNQLSQLKLTNYYIFDPAVLAGSATSGSAPLLLRHASTGQVYHVGLVSKRDLTSAGEIMEAFLKPVHKQYPIHSLGDYDGD
jgi:hypothetical protein